jgi:hypothetical protein
MRFHTGQEDKSITEAKCRNYSLSSSQTEAKRWRPKLKRSGHSRKSSVEIRTLSYYGKANKIKILHTI